MLVIEFPHPDAAIRLQTDKEYIFDKVRRKWVRLTPEEWVRQNIVQYLVQVKGYPLSLLSVEKEILVGDLRKRCDIVVFKQAQPWMIIECKQPDVPVNESVLRQVLRYNMTTCCTYLVVSNGSHHKGWRIDNAAPHEIGELPHWCETDIKPAATPAV